MTTRARARVASDQAGTRLAGLLVALGALTVAIPYLGRAIGLSVDVAGRIEVIDHVVPGALVMAVGGRVLVLARRGVVRGRWPALVGGGICCLAGFWVLATHVPLLADAARGSAGWGSALWHFSTALPIIGVSLWLALRGPERKPTEYVTTHRR